MLKLIENDPWLEPYEPAIQGRYDYYVRRKNELTDNGAKKLKDVYSFQNREDRLTEYYGFLQRQFPTHVLHSLDP